MVWKRADRPRPSFRLLYIYRYVFLFATRKASEIIQANLDYADVLIFDAGVTLLVPVIEETDVQESVPPWRQSNESDL